MDGFSEGYNFFEKNSGGVIGVDAGENYINTVNSEIDKLVKELNNFEGYGTAVGKLKGNIAEFWHAGTFNIDAAVKGSSNRANVLKSNGLGSVDIQLNTGEKYGSKYDATPIDTLKQQAKTFYERYKEYEKSCVRRGREPLDWDGYIEKNSDDLRKNGLDPNLIKKHDPLYIGQYRLVSKEQYSKIKELLKKAINKEEQVRPELAKRYQDTLDMLKENVEDAEGNESIPLTKEKAEELARLAKEGNIEPAKLGLTTEEFTTEELISYKYVFQQAFKAGITAAIISMVLKIAPEIFKAIDYLIRTGEIDENQFKNIGFAAVKGAARGFVNGSISAAITTAFKAGLCGETLKSIEPSVIGAVTVLVVNTIENAFKVAIGKMTKRDMANKLVKELFISSCSLIAGGISQTFIQIPVFGFMIGSFIGSVIGSFTYNGMYSAVLALCVDTGFTMFGLVEQDYKIPRETLEEIGIDVFNYDEFKYDNFKYDKFQYDRFEKDNFQYDSIGIKFLRRGVVGVYKIGYVT